MSSRLGCAGLLAATAVLAGCGGSGHSSTQAPPASRPSPSAAAPRTAATGPTSVGSVATTSTGWSASGTATTPHPAAPAPRSGGAPVGGGRSVGGGAPVGGGSSGSGGAAVPRVGGGNSGGNGGATNARVPATFTLSAPGSLSPRSVSAPAFLAVAVTVIDRDGRSHRVVIRTPTAHVLSVRAGGQSSVLIPGQRAGQYPVEVDGTAAAVLMIGGEPGP